ncbi:RidA family protein [Acinetobacter baumannii]|nr:RidA family protein [Acinetobacter baumannii]MDC4886118.1 RidA family protein [Acinetobacter baumannii]MDC4926764.1 RidA family protein [Acinetobacter baumannii]MDC4941146.1 RidA family protein [Acinetobacter baumannii]MDC5352967.1 RidA family protein [Acinetobacter baumannii]
MQLPFSKAVESHGFIFLSGEVPLNADGTIPEGIEAQTELVLNKIAQTLSQQSATLNDVVSVTVYLTDKSDFASFNQVYERFFVQPYPVRTTVIADLVIEAKIEITVIAKKG